MIGNNLTLPLFCWFDSDQDSTQAEDLHLCGGSEVDLRRIFDDIGIVFEQEEAL